MKVINHCSLIHVMPNKNKIYVYDPESPEFKSHIKKLIDEKQDFQIGTYERVELEEFTKGERTYFSNAIPSSTVGKLLFDPFLRPEHYTDDERVQCQKP